MRDWSLRAGDPLSLTLGADMRLCTPDYLNDHIWELDLGGGEPPSLTVRTTYGLRARAMRLFYRFAEAGRVVTDPAAFHVPPRVRRFYPNFLLLDFVPVEGLEISAEFWIPESHVLAGRLTFVNRTAFPRHLEFDLCGVLTPLDGKALAVEKQQMINVLVARSGGLEPVVFMTGGPKIGAGPHPSLALKFDFDADQSRTITWACAAQVSMQESLELARRTTGRPWDAERARIELLDAAEILDIYTGEPDWDAAFAWSQKAALGLFFPASSKLPRPSFVRTRLPDGGYSRSGDGLDYPPAWSGQSAFDAYYLASLLPVTTQLQRGLLENFLSVQTEDGTIDGRPGLAGQRSKFLAPPILASLAWNVYRATTDDSFLADVFPKLLAFLEAWFSSAHDREGDGIPEWDHVLQTGFEDHPLFDVWYPWSQALNISTLFNPELEGLLCREAASLISIADKLGLEGERSHLAERIARLTSSIAAAWNPRTSLYSYRDRLTGASWQGKLIGSRTGSGELRPRKPEFQQPVRLLIQVQTKNPSAKRPVVHIYGLACTPTTFDPQKEESAAGVPGGASRKQQERVEEQQFQWHTGGLVATSQMVYESLERITIDGLAEKDKLVVRTVDTTAEDITLFTPLWAHLPHPDHAQSILNRLTRDGDGFNRPYGIPALPASPAGSRAGIKERAEADAVAMSVHLPWNQMIGEGLLAYGYRDEAARLTTRLMGAVVRSLKQSRAFYERYHAVEGTGLGERGALTGLAPLGLFLQTLGVQILSPTVVRLEGRNPFPWPVTILYKGLRVVRGLESTQVVFTNSRIVTVTDPAPCTVSL